MRAFDAGEAERPPPGLIEVWEKKSSWDPEQDVVVRPPALGELKNPLVADLDAVPGRVVLDVLNEFGDVGGVPHPVFAIREGREKGRKPRAAASQLAPCCVC